MDCHRTRVSSVGYSSFPGLLQAQLVLREGWQKALAVARSCAHPQKAGTTGKGEITHFAVSSDFVVLTAPDPNGNFIPLKPDPKGILAFMLCYI